MTLWRLVFQEIRHRKLNFALALLSVVAAAACLIASLTVLRAHDLRTEQIMAKQEDDMRKITKRMGFNVIILPQDQNLSDLFADNYASKFMPESYADKLAGSKIVTINHLLPALEQRIRWPERNDRTMILIGVKGQVPLAHADEKKPIMDPVPAGSIILGAELARTENLKAGDELTLMGRSFKVAKVHAARGDKDDLTAWINLGEAQQMLDKAGLINSIRALECECAFADLPKVRAEIQGILPDTQVIELGTIALARAEARRAADLARAEVRQQRESFAAVLVPLAIVAASVWIGLLAMLNVRDRRQEIGVLRALGYRSSQVLAIFLSKAALIGLVGAAAGYAIGLAAGLGFGTRLEDLKLDLNMSTQMVRASHLILLLLAAPLLAAVASWLPAIAAAQQDPAVVLREE